MLTRWGMTMLVFGIVLGVPLGATLWPKEKVIVRQGTPDTPAAVTSVNLMINYASGTVKTWNTITHHESMSVLNLLETVHAAGGIVLLTGADGSGKSGVFSIDGLGNDPKSGLSWHFWVNNVYEPRAASKYYLRPGDIVVWSYTKAAE